MTDPKPLPAFAPQPRERVFAFIHSIFARGKETYLRDLIAYEDGHFRALFDPAYFALAAGQSAPSRSQWNTLKKKLKHHDPRIFVFKEHGETRCGEQVCCYLDFGYFAG